jgi:hypothetical protein
MCLLTAIKGKLNVDEHLITDSFTWDKIGIEAPERIADTKKCEKNYQIKFRLWPYSWRLIMWIGHKFE